MSPCELCASSSSSSSSSLQLAQTMTNSNSNRKRRLFRNRFISAAKKLCGLFSVSLPRNRKGKASNAIDEASPPESTARVSALFSSSSYARSSSKARSSFSHGSSSYSAASPATVGNGHVVSSGVTYAEILKSTANFSESNLMGEGAFGTVYRGKLKDGSLVAVKRAKKNIFGQNVSSEFKNEVLTMSKIEHLNLVRLYKYLEQGGEKIIVEEYVGNGTLRGHLDGKVGNGLEMAERLDIATDVAHAVAYLHTYADTPIIHRDIKASNILITEKLRAKVADFGFARLASEDPNATHISTQVKGSTGYLDPEYLRTYQLTDKSDVYSFGVVLVEMMTGRHPIESKRPLKERVTIKWAMQKLKEGDAVLVMDWRLRRNPASIIALENILKLARQCLASPKELRPSMRRCAEVLWQVRKGFRERASSPLPSTYHHSSTYPARDAMDHRHTSFGVKEDESYKFVSA